MDMDIYKKFQNGVPVSLRDFENIDLLEENPLIFLGDLEKAFKKVKRNKLSLNAYLISRQIILSLQKKVEAIMSIDEESLSKIRDNEMDLIKLARFKSIEEIDTHYEMKLFQYVEQLYAELSNDSTYHICDCDTKSLNIELLNESINRFKKEAESSLSKEKKQTIRLFLQKEKIKKSRDELVRRFVDDYVKEDEIINYAVTGSIYINASDS